MDFFKSFLAEIDKKNLENGYLSILYNEKFMENLKNEHFSHNFLIKIFQKSKFFHLITFPDNRHLPIFSFQ